MSFKQLRRTRATGLTDNELCLLDMLFSQNVIVNNLLEDIIIQDYSLSNNILTDATLVSKIINKFIENKLVKIEIITLANNLYSTIGLTSKGGKIWEIEREPIWDKFILDLSVENEGNLELNVLSISEKVARKFLHICQECNIYRTAKLDNLKFRVNNSDQTMIPWKHFDVIYNFQISLCDCYSSCNYTGNDVDWETYYRKIDWWRTIKELDMLYGQ